MKKVFYSSLAVLGLLVIATPAEAKGKPHKQQKHTVRTTEVAPNSNSTTVNTPQINTSGIPVTNGSQTIITNTSENSTLVIGNPLNHNRSNRGGMMRGLDRASHVQEMNKLRRNPNVQIIPSDLNSSQTQTQVNTQTQTQINTSTTSSQN